jgi:hypothetical protein
MSARELVNALSARGIALSVVEGRLQARPASALTPQDRDAIRSVLTDLVALLIPVPALTGPEPWDPAVAIQLMHDADSLVAQADLDGRHPVLVDAAGMVQDAYFTRDLGTLRFAVTEFAFAVRNVTRERNSAARGAQADRRAHLVESSSRGEGTAPR